MKCVEAFDRFPDQSSVLDELHPMLRAVGRLLVATIDPMTPMTSQLARLSSQMVAQPLPLPARDELCRRGASCARSASWPTRLW